MPIGHTVRVIRGGGVVKTSVELGSLRGVQKTANGFLNRFGGECVTICQDGKLLCSRKKNTLGALMPWKHNKGRKSC